MLLTAVDEGLGACFFGIPPERLAAVPAGVRRARGLPAGRLRVGRLSRGRRPAVAVAAPRPARRRGGRAPRPLVTSARAHVARHRELVQRCRARFDRGERPREAEHGDAAGREPRRATSLADLRAAPTVVEVSRELPRSTGCGRRRPRSARRRASPGEPRAAPRRCCRRSARRRRTAAARRQLRARRSQVCAARRAGRDEHPVGRQSRPRSSQAPIAAARRSPCPVSGRSASTAPSAALA